MPEGVDLEDLRSFTAVFIAAKRSGGDMLAIIKDTAAQIGDKIDVKREIETILAAKQYEFRVMSAVPYVIIGYMNVKFPGIYGHFIWKSGRNRGDDGMFADLCGRVLSWIKDHKDRSLILVLAGLMLAGGSDPSGGGLCRHQAGRYRRSPEKFLRRGRKERGL